MATVNEDELEGMPDPELKTSFRVTGLLREEYLSEDELPDTGDEIQVRRGARVVSVNRKEGPTSGDVVVVTVRLDEPR